MGKLVYWLLGGILAWALALSGATLVLAFINAVTGMRLMV